MMQYLYRLSTLCKKEIRLLTTTPSALVAVLFMLLGTGIPFLFPDQSSSAASFALRNYVSRIPFLAIVVFPALTMGIWSDEKRSGTETLILSLPVPDSLLVIGKFFSLLIIYTLTLILTLPISLSTSVGGGVLFSTYLMLFLYGASMLALGQFLSMLFSGPIISFLVTAAVIFILDTIQLLPHAVLMPAIIASACAQLSFAWHFEAAARGILDTRDVFFYLIPCIAFLLGNCMCINKERKRK